MRYIIYINTGIHMCTPEMLILGMPILGFIDLGDTEIQGIQGMRRITRIIGMNGI